MPTALVFTLFVAALAVGFAAWVGRRVFEAPAEDGFEAVRAPLRSALGGYLHRVSVTLGSIGTALFLLLWWLAGVRTAIGLVIGIFVARAAAHLLMEATTHLAASSGAQAGSSAQVLRRVSRAGRAGGALIGGLGLLAVSGFYLILRLMTPTGDSFDMRPLIGLGIGVTLVSLYVRLGGELFTRSTLLARRAEPAADPAAAAILETLGRNAGLLTGVGVELLESFVLTLLGTMLLGNLLLGSSPLALQYPLLLGAFGLLAFMAAELLVYRPRDAGRAPEPFRVLWAVIGLALIAFYLLALTFPEQAPPSASPSLYPRPLSLFTAELLGLGLAAAMLLLARLGRSTRAAGAWAGAAMHGGVVLALATGVWSAYSLAAHYGVAVAVLAVQTLAAPFAVLAAYTPAYANLREMAALAGGAEMDAGEAPALRELERMTGGATRTFVIATALLASLVLFLGLARLMGPAGGGALHPALTDMRVVAGLLVGALLPYLFHVAQAEAVARGAARLDMELARSVARTERPCAELERAADRLARAAHWELVRIVWLPLAVVAALALVLGGPGLGGVLVGATIAALIAALVLREAMAPGAARRATDRPTVAYESVTMGPPIGPVIKALALMSLLIAPYL